LKRMNISPNTVKNYLNGLKLLVALSSGDLTKPSILY
jgi:DNA-binding CsgD family transcriptional regulator